MRLLVIGAGGHAKVVIDAAQAAGHTIAGVVGARDDASEILGHPVAMNTDGIDADGFVVAIGDNSTRARYYDKCLDLGLAPTSVVHPSTILGSDVELGTGTFIAAGVVINTGARIGENVILNTGCTIDHDCVIGDHSHIGPQVALCGAVTLGNGVLLGVGSCAAPGAAVGEWSVVGAGAAIVDELPEYSLCVGVPARAVRTLEDADRD